MHNKVDNLFSLVRSRSAAGMTGRLPISAPDRDELGTDHLQADLKGRSVRGAFLTVGTQALNFLVQTISTVVLARVLSPSDFGLVAMVTVVTNLGLAFADLGLSEATIQRKEITHEQVTVLFWVNLAIGIGLMLITATMAPLLVWINREPRLAAITFVSSLIFVIGGLRVQPDALLKRQMRYVSLGIRDLVSLAVGVAVAITVALRGGGYWAIVAMPLTTNGLQMALSWLMIRWRPGLPRSGSNVKSMVAFGGNVAASYLVFTFNRSADNALIGWYWGAAPLGLYSRAYNLLMMPVRQLSAPVAGVAVPAFSRIQNDSERYARSYLAVMGLVMWVSLPLFGILLVAAEPVVVFVLGSQWREAAPVFQFLSISGPAQMLLDSTVWLLVSRGQSHRLLRLLLCITPFIVGSFVIGLPFGIKSVALCYSLAMLAIMPWMLRYAFRGTPLTLTSLAKALVYPTVVGLSGILVSEISLHLFKPEKVLTQLIAVGVGFLVTYSVAALIRPVRQEILSFRKLLTQLKRPA
jgi:PST family polysaccharide transporter